MRKVEGLAIKYVGYNEPKTEEEADLEILGLESAIATARHRIAVLKQSVYLQLLAEKSKIEEPADEETVEEAPDIEKVEQEG